LAEIDFLSMQQINSAHIQLEAKTFTRDDHNSKRSIFEQITDSITIWSEGIHIKFSYNPTLFGYTPDSQRIMKDER
jgi:hypothetical protein